jgi:hypothetical protein
MINIQMALTGHYVRIEHGMESKTKSML